MKYTLEITDHNVKLYNGTDQLGEKSYDNVCVSLYDALRSIIGIAGDDYKELVELASLMESTL